MLGKLRNAVRVGVLTVHTQLTRKRYATYVYQTPWLQGKYAVHTNKKASNIMDLITDQIIELLPFEPTANQLRAIRNNPQVTILDTY